MRLLLTRPLSAAENMALDEALMARAARTGESVFRVYGWAQPTLSLGRNQRARGVYDPDLACRNGCAVVRRMTGGRALLHHREVTYSVTAPAPSHLSVRAAYGSINQLLLAALQSMGVGAALAEPTERAALPESAPCFERPGAGEIVVGDRKLVGSAQLQENGALLQHGSILVEDDQHLIAALARKPVGPVQPAATLTASLGRSPSLDEVATALFTAARVLDRGAERWELDAETLGAQADLVARYQSDDWTWRR